MFYFTATKTVLDIKIDVSMLTNIPVSKQVWRGWPESIADELSLAQIGISRKHKLYVKPKDETSRNVSPVISLNDCYPRDVCLSMTLSIISSEKSHNRSKNMLLIKVVKYFFRVIFSPKRSKKEVFRKSWEN